MWPMHTIKELLERAESHGFSEVSLSSRKEAELFRYSIKNYKRRYKVGDNLTTKVIEKTVLIHRKPEVKLKEFLTEESTK